MNIKAITFLKNFSYTLSSNLIAITISTIVILVVPKFIGVEKYGYWQLYLFYSAYVGFLHFGWNDGVYLRYGGKEYKELNKDLFFSQFWMLVIFQALMSILILVVATNLGIEANKLFIVKMTALCMIFVNIRLMLIYILQITNRIKEYAYITLMEKVLYCFIIILLLFVGVSDYKLLILADIVGKLVSLIYSVYCCRDIVFKRVSQFYFSIKETSENINVGLKLMFANIASMLIIGIVRFGIERTWDVTTFGKVSLALSVSNLMMLFINAIGIILFPILRRTDENKLSAIYITMRTLLMVFLLGLLGVYYPLKNILTFWLPQYTESFYYMAILFPICIYEGRMALLINTYLKTLRKEKLILTVNIVSMLLSCILTILFTIVFKNLHITIVTIVIILAFRCVLAEVYLSRILDFSYYKDLLYEKVLVLTFILIGLYVNSLIGITLYLSAYGLYLFINRKNIIGAYIVLKQYIRG
ncbi:oligosaccharide flippase family protein [Fictibacillus nanhaiensis]|uniref:oligosaccharide flippase family protein n=1 Tax=Fictibacillus nanhaiensis TaxID=742169 RepID=UPI002E21C5D0|nr:oligosaccharide flippase family protein [Fictibacillus nanhaiensis]MED1863949.1 oligosaccharide flippase family protein [Fictibacillus nanhaiensis]